MSLFPPFFYQFLLHHYSFISFFFLSLLSTSFIAHFILSFLHSLLQSFWTSLLSASFWWYWVLLSYFNKSFFLPFFSLSSHFVYFSYCSFSWGDTSRHYDKSDSKFIDISDLKIPLYGYYVIFVDICCFYLVTLMPICRIYTIVAKRNCRRFHRDADMFHWAKHKRTKVELGCCCHAPYWLTFFWSILPFDTHFTLLLVSMGILIY